MFMLRASSAHRWLAVLCLGCCAVLAAPAPAAEPAPKVYVVLWIVVEDYILPASDDAALRLADYLSRQHIRANMLLVGERARVLQKRGRNDVIAALGKHEIGFHGNFHSVHPTPASYLATLGWDEGVAEFERREKPGYDSIRDITGAAPSSYCQPGGSWGPQSYGALRKWGTTVHIGTGNHIGLDGRPHYYCGVLNLAGLSHTFSTELDKKGLKKAEDRLLAARERLLAEKGGVISLYYHECEFVHKDYWDAVNFKRGANPPRERWQLPPVKTAEQSRSAYEAFESFIEFAGRFPDVQFITASEAARLYRDRARNRRFSTAEIKEIAQGVGPEITFQKRDDHALSAAEVFALLNEFVILGAAGEPTGPICLGESLLGPTHTVSPLTEPVRADASQFTRTALDVADFCRRHGRIPGAVWLGSVAVPPESYLRALAQVALERLDRRALPESITIPAARLGTAKYVADDAAALWDWVILPAGLQAPAMMELAKRQAWTMKPALLDRAGQ
jgi:hypothetical protein